VQKPNGDLEYTEWAPGAKSLTIFGDFNAWNREEHRCAKNEFGCHTITHNTKYKINIEGPGGERKDRNSAWSRY
jgi:1,4-alpha-glucan branching enzyme